jgi:hypothetical protein
MAATVTAILSRGMRTAGLALTVALALGMSAASSGVGNKGPRNGPGCDPSRPAVAHRLGGQRLARQPAHRPIPCLTVVGQTSESATVGVTRSGAVLYAPLLQNSTAPPTNVLQGPEFVVRSNDRGATWTTLDSGGPTTGGLVPPWMSVDPHTSRIWFATTLPSLCGARISWSDDDGDHWRTNASVGCPAQGGEKLLEGPPPAAGARPVGYPHVVYYCANATDIAASNLWCYKSLDGGATFKFVGGFPDPTPPAGCSERHPSRPGVAGPDGVLYFPTTLCGALGIAISRDEGATWQFRPIVESGFQDVYTAGTAVDRHGTLYIAWIGPGTLPYLVTSTDRGLSWSAPMMVAAPGVQAVRRVAIAVRKRGQVALAYLGTTDGAHFNGYITESRDVLTERPRFWSASVNDPGEPLVNAADSETFGDRFFFGTDTMTSDGTVWAGFHCAKTGACPGRRVGVVGRLTERPGRPR